MDNKRCGWGDFTGSDGTVYQGNYKDDKRDGPGTINYSDASKYWGDWKNDRICGYGNWVFADKTSYSGGFNSESKFHGEGQYVTAKDKYYTGNWVEGKKNGRGR